jgi:hypothetical protein
LSVRYNCIGLAPEQLETIFDLLTQVHSSRARSARGAGTWPDPRAPRIGTARWAHRGAQCRFGLRKRVHRAAARTSTGCGSCSQASS